MDPDEFVIFVEGMTDYNYLTAMKYILENDEFKKFIFIPIEGVGKNKRKIKNKLKKLKEIRKYNCILLTDGDKNGKLIYDINSKDENKITVINLPTIDPNFIEIEDLFYQKEKEYFYMNSKDSWSSILFKKMITVNPSLVCNETKNSFKKIFDYLLNIIQKSLFKLNQKISES